MATQRPIIPLLVLALCAASAARAETPAATPDHPLFQPPSRWYGPHAVRHAADVLRASGEDATDVRHASPVARSASPLSELRLADADTDESGLIARLKRLARWRTPWGQLKLEFGSEGSASLQFASRGGGAEPPHDPAAAPDLDLDEPLVPRLGAVRVD